MGVLRACSRSHHFELSGLAAQSLVVVITSTGAGPPSASTALALQVEAAVQWVADGGATLHVRTYGKSFLWTSVGTRNTCLQPVAKHKTLLTEPRPIIIGLVITFIVRSAVQWVGHILSALPYSAELPVLGRTSSQMGFVTLARQRIIIQIILALSSSRKLIIFAIAPASAVSGVANVAAAGPIVTELFQGQAAHLPQLHGQENGP